MKKIVLFVVILAMFMSCTQLASAGGAEFSCYLAGEETREGLGDSIGASVARFIPIPDTESYHANIYKDGILVEELEEWASANDVPVYLQAYTIGGNNYFKLRDICESFNISVNWDEQQQLITVDHTKPYNN